MELRNLKGTTTVGITFKDGVVLAADKRASAGTFIASKVAKKIHPITRRIAFTISGLVADAQILVRWMKNYMNRLTLMRGREPTVREVANLVSVVMHDYFKSLSPFITHLLIGGYDRRGPHIYFLDHAGGVQEDKYLATGSGSPIAMGILESGYRDDLAEDEAILLALRALSAAMKRDTATGDGIDLVVIKKEGIRTFTPKEIDELLKKINSHSKK